MIMKQKYIMPKAELIEIKANAILVGSTQISDQGSLDYSNGLTSGTGSPDAARAPMSFDVWEDIDETNGYK